MTEEQLRERGLIRLTIPESVGDLANMIQDHVLADRQRTMRVTIRVERERCAKATEAWAAMMIRNKFTEMLDVQDAADQIAAFIRKGA